jgi:hypothetical protein
LSGSGFSWAQRFATVSPAAAKVAKVRFIQYLLEELIRAMPAPRSSAHI